MRKYRTIITPVLLLILLAAPLAGVSWAQIDDTVNTETDEPGVENTDDETSVEEQPASDSEREARKLERQERIQTNMDEAKARRTAARCEAAQTKLANADKRATTIGDAWTQKYQNITSKLTEIAQRLELAGTDTVNLASATQGVDDLVGEFFEILADYQQAITDSAEIDCENDVDGFVLALEDARTQRTALRDKAGEIRREVTLSVIPELNSIKQSLNTDNDSSDDNSSETNDEE